VSEFEGTAPRLLVSVRSVAEAEEALAGGCDVLDIKEPARGALGMADVATIGAIIALRDQTFANVPVSVALGEAAEWRPGRPIPLLPEGIAYLKLGTAGLAPNPDWPEQLPDIRERFDTARAGGGSRGARWIAVACADATDVAGPSPEQVLDVAARSGWAGILIDTCSKQSRCLFDWLDDSRLAALATEARSRNLLFALAGRLRQEDVIRLADLQPDTVGIRSAACRLGDRTGPVEARRVLAFRAALRRAVEIQPA
jgi:(5-formylfuran-3-yl)methyl phosphate synthase